MAPTTRSATQLAARLRESRSSDDSDINTRVKSASRQKLSTRKRTTTRISKPKGATATTRSVKKKGPGKGKSATRNRSTTIGTHHDSDTRIRVDDDEIVDTPPTLELGGQLNLHFPQSRHFYAGELEDLPDYPNCLLHAKYPVKNQSPATINVTASSVSSEHCIVFTGTMEPGNQQVIIKYAPMKGLLEERAAYQYMEALQGTVIPKFYGLFFGREEEYIIHSCMVLEHCGTAVSKSFSSLPRTEIGKVLNVLAKIHRAGLHHLDFAERNVVVAPDGGYRIIDFEHMEDHTCRVSPEFDFSTGAELPQDSDEYLDNVACCYRISRVAVKTGYYDPHRGKVYLDGRYYSNMPSQDFVDALMKYIPGIPYLLDELYHSWQVAYFRKIAELQNDGVTLEQLRKDAPQLYERIQDDWQAANRNTSPYCGFPGFQIRDDPQMYLRTHNYQRPPPDYQHPREMSQGILVTDSNHVPQPRRDSPSPQT